MATSLQVTENYQHLWCLPQNIFLLWRKAEFAHGCANAEYSAGWISSAYSSMIHKGLWAEEMLQKLGTRELPYAPLSLVLPQFYAWLHTDFLRKLASRDAFYWGVGGLGMTWGWGFQEHLRDLGNLLTLASENWDILFFLSGDGHASQHINSLLCMIPCNENYNFSDVTPH